MGNGRLGVMIYGRTDTERLQLNEESLWAGSQINNNNPTALDNLDRIRELILNDRLTEAVKLAEKKMLGTPPRKRSYQTLGDLYLDFGDRKTNDYRRELDLNTGIFKSTYTSNVVTYTEEVLASAPDNLIALSLISSKNSN